jgi:hypothetical protein
MGRTREENDMNRTLAASLILALTAGASAQSAGPSDPLPSQIPTSKFERLHKMLLPTTDELADFWTLPWEVNVQEARIKAAAQDKPILAYFGANGSSLGAT